MLGLTKYTSKQRKNRRGRGEEEGVSKRYHLQPDKFGNAPSQKQKKKQQRTNLEKQKPLSSSTLITS
jgi:hypothetical protein